MANYTKVFTKPYADGYEDLPSQTTPITAETLNDKDDTLEHIEDYLYNNPIAEVVDNLTSNDATKALSAKQGKILNDTKLNVADLPNSDVQTSNDGQFTTVTGGLMQKCLIDLEPIQSGSGTPSPSNVRPITGHTSVSVGNVGKNKFDKNNPFILKAYNNNSVITSASVANMIIIPCKPNTTYTISKIQTSSNQISESSVYPSIGGSATLLYNQTNVSNVTVTTGATARWLLCYLSHDNYDNLTNVINSLQIEEGSQATEYEPYNGYTHIINLGGTYYGGTLDAVSGVFTVTHALYSDTWGNGTGATDLGSVTRKIFDFTSVGLSKNEATTSRMNCADYLNSWAENSTHYTINSSSHKDLYLFLPNGTSSDFVFQLCYELATPTTIQLDPQTLETLVGQNDVFAPLVGQSVEEVEFREVMAFEDVPKAIPYECVDPIGDAPLFKIHKYGRVVVLKFVDLEYTPVVSEDGWAILGRLPERFYHKYPNQMVAENMIFGVINDNNGTLQMKKLIIDQYNGDVKIYFLANEQIKPLGSITYILDHD